MPPILPFVTSLLLTSATVSNVINTYSFATRFARCRGSTYFEDVLPRAIDAQSLEFAYNDEYVMSLAILYHVSLGESVR